MRITMNDGRSFSGTAVQIVQGMQSVAFDKKSASLSEYMDWVVDNAQRLNEVQLNVTGDTDDARAESLVAELVRAGLAR